MARDYIEFDVVIRYGSTIIADRVKFHNAEGQGYTEAQVPSAVQDGLNKIGKCLGDMLAARFPQTTSE